MSARDDIMWMKCRRPHQRDGVTLLWPERNLGEHWQPGQLAAEVERALAKPIAEHSKHVTATPAPMPETMMTLAEAARSVGISPAAMLKRSRKFGSLKLAVAMGGRHDRAAGSAMS